MNKKLPKFDTIRSLNCRPGMYRRNRVQGQSLNELKAFVDAAIALHGGESLFSMCEGYDGYPGYISLVLEPDIKAEREEAEAADERNKERLKVWNALSPAQRKALE